MSRGRGDTTPLDAGDARPAAVEGAPGEPPRSSMVGQVVAGKYQLLRLLGEGGMGSVYEARHTQTLKRCALKVLVSPGLAEHPDVVRRFFREAKASGVVESDHIVQIFDSGSDAAGLPYMVMELLNGEDIEALRVRIGALPQPVAAKLVLQAATGLAKAHEAGIVHRDIKPANLFLSRRDDGHVVVKVLDFGIAKVKMESLADTSHGLTKSGSLLGTPLYMSPEQARGKSWIDARTDVWSLGAVLFVLLSGKRPFVAEGLGDLLLAIMTEELPRVQDHAPWVSAEMAAVVRRAMERDVDKRFQNGGELRDALARIVGPSTQIHETELVPISDAERSSVAPRRDVTEDRSQVVAQSGVSLVTTGAAARPSRWLVPAAAAALVVGGVALAALVRKGSAPAAAQPEAAAAPAAPSASGPEVVAAQRYELIVIGDGAKATVDGLEAPVRDGKLELQGNLGDARRVVASDGAGRERTVVVAITATGLVPSSIDLGPAPAASASAVPAAAARPGDGKGGPKTASKAAPGEAAGKPDPNAPKDPGAAAAKPKPKVETSLDEFGK